MIVITIIIMMVDEETTITITTMTIITTTTMIMIITLIARVTKDGLIMIKTMIMIKCITAREQIEITTTAQISGSQSVAITARTSTKVATHTVTHIRILVRHVKTGR